MTTKLTLSPEALAALRLRMPLEACANHVIAPDGGILFSIPYYFPGGPDAAAFIAALVNAALTPADAGAAEPVTGRTVLSSESAGRAAHQVTS